MGQPTALALYFRTLRQSHAPRKGPVHPAAYLAFLREAVREVQSNWEDYDDWQIRRRINFIVQRLDRVPVDVRQSTDETLRAAGVALVTELHALLETARAGGLLSYESTFR
jgi:hypothetical protein